MDILLDHSSGLSREILRFFIRNSSAEFLQVSPELSQTPVTDISLYTMLFIIPNKLVIEGNHIIHVTLLIILGGDVETNPGPRTKKVSADKKRAQNRINKRAQRDREDKNAKEKRLESDKVNKNLKRKLETAEEKCEIQLLDKVLTAKRRKVEIPEHKAQRLQTQKFRTNAHRQLETTEKTVHRLQGQKVRTTTNRKLETAQKTVHRLQGQKVRTTTNRKLETPQKTVHRLQGQKVRTTTNRKLETVQKRVHRLQGQKDRTTTNRNLETAEQTAQRKLRDNISKANKRKIETSEQTAQRKLQDNSSKANKRKMETSEQAAQRKLRGKISKANKRKMETSEQTTRRKLCDNISKANKRKMETPEQTAQRKFSDKMSKASKRNLETLEQTVIRRKVQRVITAKNKKSQTQQEKAKLKEKERERLAQSRNAADDVSEITRLFQKKVQSGPDFVCTCCHRIMYRQTVKLYDKGKYPKLSEEEYRTLLEPYIYTSIDGNTWICVTCDRSLCRGKMPKQAKANNLMLDNTPDELAELNDIEIRLLSLRIPFMKIVALPRGKQKAIHGPAVNIPTKLDVVCNLLPRLPNEAEILPMKLKRKLCYKSHYMYDSVHPQKMIAALQWLIKNNQLYSETQLNVNWTKEWNESDPELWQAVTGSVPSNTSSQFSDKETKEHATPSSSKVVMRRVCSPIPDTFMHLKQLCNQEGYSIENVPGDGNCFYHAVAKQLQHNGVLCQYHKNHPLLRKDLLNYLETHPKGEQGQLAYRDFLANRTVEGDTEPNTAQDQYVENISNEDDRLELRWQRYLQDMEQGSWADHIAVQGMADMLHVSIRIVATANPNTVVRPSDGKVNDILHLGLIGQLHYVSLIRTEMDETVEVTEVKHGDGMKREQHVNRDEGLSSDKSQHSKQNIDKEFEKEKLDDSVEYERECEAFDTSSKLRGLPYDTCLQAENIDVNQIISVAPGEGMKPVNILTDQSFEEMAFPHMYPLGKGGFSEERKEKLTVRKFFNQRLLDVDGRFAKDVDYLLAAQYSVEQDQIDHLQSIVIRQMSGRLYQGQKLTAAVLKDPDKLNQLVQKDYGYRLLKEVRGTPAYWQKVHYEVLAMIRQLGIPTWFLTLSAADMKWPEVIQIIARQYGTILTEAQVANLTWEDKCTWLRRNPVTAARHFQYRLDLFWSEFLKSKANPIGKVTDYMIRIEFQARGSPHAHTILWIENAPKFGTDPVEEVTAFIDRYQTCDNPSDDTELHELVQLQSHVHSSSCIRKGSCRFGIPKLPSPMTLISSEPEEDNDRLEKLQAAKEIFTKVTDMIKDIDTLENVTLEQLLHACNIPMDNYLAALNTSKRGHTLVLRRTPQEMNINSYNPSILRAWKANMDIQYILDAYACVMYVTSYMMKSERAMGELLKHVTKESAGLDIRSQLRKLGSTFLNHRELSCQEASYRLLSLPLKKLSRKCVFINTDPKNERLAMTKPLSSIENLENDEEDLYLKSLIDRYAARPNKLENMCLAEFVAKYDVKYSQKLEDDNDHTPNPLEKKETEITDTISLKDGLGQMKRRSHEAVIRFPKYNSEKDSEKYFRGKLMLYTPWRDEDQLIGQSDSFFDNYRLLLDEITENEQRYTKNGPTFEEAVQDLNEYGPPLHAFANVAPNAEQQRLQDEEEGIFEERPLEQQDLDENEKLIQGQNNRVSHRFDTQTDTNLLSSADYCTRMQQLNKEQRNIVCYHRNWCKSVVEALKNNKPAPKSYKQFISGPGGVGKSHVIELLKNDTVRFFRYLPSVEQTDILCLVCAPTGTAAFNVSGMTIHSTFLIPINMRQYRKLGADSLNTLRNQLANLKVVIIDEISMVGADILYHIHRRLEEITGYTGPDVTFGNVTVIAVGDLYQLPPVCRNFVFDHPNDSYAQLADPLWYQFQLAELSQIMRQKDDAKFAELLNHVRTATCSEQDLATLKSREIKENSLNYPTNSLHVYSLHKLVDKHNEKMLNKIKQHVYIIKAIDSKKDRNTGLDIEMPEKSSDTGGLESELKIAVGCRVMLVSNIDVNDGLSNGVTGTVSHIVVLADKVVTVLVEFDNPKVGIKAKRLSHYRDNHPNAVPVTRHEIGFDIGKRKCVNATRRQFPLKLCWASTIHKVQGLTTESIVVSFEGRFFAGQAYVALSRVKTLKGLYILNFDEKKIFVDKAVTEEMERLRKDHALTREVSEDLSLEGCIKISHLNIRGIKSHKHDLRLDSCVQESDVLCLCETFLRNEKIFCGEFIGREDMSVFSIERPQQERDFHTPRGSGGILVAIRHDLKPVLLESKNSPHLELLAIEINRVQGQLLLVTLYRPPNANIRVFLQDLEKLLNDLYSVHTDCVILGDFNEDIFKSQGPIFSFFQSKGFQQNTNRATRDSGSLLDHCYTSSGLKVASISVRDTYYSDHDIVSITIV